MLECFKIRGTNRQEREHNSATVKSLGGVKIIQGASEKAKNNPTVFSLEVQDGENTLTYQIRAGDKLILPQGEKDERRVILEAKSVLDNMSTAEVFRKHIPNIQGSLLYNVANGTRDDFGEKGYKGVNEVNGGWIIFTDSNSVRGSTCFAPSKMRSDGSLEVPGAPSYYFNPEGTEIYSRELGVRVKAINHILS